MIFCWQIDLKDDMLPDVKDTTNNICSDVILM